MAHELRSPTIVVVSDAACADASLAEQLVIVASRYIFEKATDQTARMLELDVEQLLYRAAPDIGLGCEVETGVSPIGLHSMTIWLVDKVSGQRLSVADATARLDATRR
jgi:hypothetical protein